jgi:hypothetical protein
MTSWVAPAESVRISTFRPIRPPFPVNGNCRSASWIIVMWSAAVFDPALPGRNIIAKGSPVPSLP